MTTRRTALLALALLLVAMPAAAQEPYPTRPITIVVPFPPGGIADLTARPLAAAMERLVKQPVVITNKAGAGGGVGTQSVAIARPDGYTLLLGLVSISLLPERDLLFGQKPAYTRDQFVGIARLNADPPVLAVNAELPWKSVKELLDDARKRPGEITYASSGIYGASHVPTALLARVAGNVQMRHLPTTGGGPAVTAVLGGNASFFMSPTSIAIPHIKSGKVRPLAVSSSVRAKSLPEVPTFKEQGYDLEYYFWVGLFAPKGTPDPVIAKLREAIKTATHSSEFSGTLDKLGQELAYMDQPEFASFWATDAKRMEEAINSIGRVQG